MKYIRDYKSYKDYNSINEEFIGKMVKGALSKLFQAFATPFKDLVNDIKTSFKDSDPNSIKQIVLTNLNQAIDAAQTTIMDKNIQDDSVSGLMNKFIESLQELANGIGKDFTTAIGERSKSSAAYEVAKAILLGSKEAKWVGIVGLMQDSNYMYSRTKYEQALTKAATNKSGDQALKAKKEAAIKFFDGFQKNINASIDKELTGDEILKIYNDSKKKAGGEANISFDQLKEFLDKKVKVKYKRNGYDDSKKPEEQMDKVGEKEIEELDEAGGKVFFTTEDDEKFQKAFSDILGAVEAKPEEDVQKQLSDKLGKLKSDKDKMGQVNKFVDILEDPAKAADLDEIKKILNK